MSDLAFALHLGGGLFVDSTGALHQSAPPDVPVYEVASPLPGDIKKARDAFSDVKKALKDIEKDKDVLKTVMNFGLGFVDEEMAKTLLSVLSVAGKIAGVIAPVLAVASFAVDVLSLLGVIKTGPTPFERDVMQRFDDLETQGRGIAQLIGLKDLRDGRVAVENLTAAVRSSVEQQENTILSAQQLDAEFNRLFDEHGDHIDRIGNLLDAQTWFAPFDRDTNRLVWPWLGWPSAQNLLHTHPGAGMQPPVPVIYPADEQPHFDHRLMVPLALFAGTSYLAAIRGIAPEYRTTGDFREHLRLFANKIEELAQAMRANNLARTIYTADHFARVMLGQDDVIPTATVNTVFGPIAADFAVAPSCSAWPVGAMDLRYNDDLFFEPLVHGLARIPSLYDTHPPQSKKGGMNLRWIPPAVLKQEFPPEPVVGPPGWRITNPEECAQAANAQSEEDYAVLLSVSGYAELLQLATLFRHEATEPDRSQTVRPKPVRSYRKPLPSERITVTTEIFPGWPPVTSEARQEPQQCVSTVSILTQPPNRPRPVGYKLYLRTLGSVRAETAYSTFCSPHYEDDPKDPRFKRLSIVRKDQILLDEHPLVPGDAQGWVATPRGEPIEFEGHVELTAKTFDLWVPVRPPFQIDWPFAKTAAALRGVGNVSAGPPLLSRTPNYSKDDLLPRISDTPIDLGIEVDPHGIPAFWEEREDWEGQRREPREETVRLSYNVTWDNDLLRVTVRNDPAHRNYVVFVAIEEKMIASANVLHTAVPLAINGMRTYVPSRFFDEEEAALAEVANMLDDINRRFSIEAPPKLLDTIAGWVRPGDLASREAIARYVRLAEEHQPGLLGRVVEEMRTEPGPP